mgnify:CR=1 FL=1
MSTLQKKILDHYLALQERLIPFQKKPNKVPFALNAHKLIGGRACCRKNAGCVDLGGRRSLKKKTFAAADLLSTTL